ncbi:MAG: hypothetical protein KDB90_10915 [Planctomycetes bacterium]|nr:hypothetical protein [Planctomycetota bacterium]
MSRLLYKTGLPLAFCAALILTLPACSGGPEEIWQPEALVEETPVEAMHFNESVSSGKLTLTASQKVVARETPIERLTLLYTDSHIEFDWESFGFTFFAILGGIVSVGLYFVVAYVLYDPNKDDKNK